MKNPNRLSLLIIGNGQLGRELTELCISNNIQYNVVDLPEFDITDPNCIDKTIDNKYSIVINASAYTNVDKAESDIKISNKVNADGPYLLALKCKKEKIPLIHISTDYVFDGEKKTPYLETDVINPVNQYGKSKELGETKIRSVLDQHIIIRTSWLYSTFGNNFVKSMLNLFENRKELSIVDDQFGSPTYAFDLAETILLICEKIHGEQFKKWGTYHYSNIGKVSWFGFANKILELTKNYMSFQIDILKGIKTAEYPTAAIRPKHTVLDCTSITNNIGIDTKPWDDRLKLMITKLMENK